MFEKVKPKETNWLERLTNQRAFWPVLALIIIIIVNRLIGPEFFTIRDVEGRFVGSLIDILNRASPVILLCIGMTLVIATKGIDLSVGAIIAISGATAAVLVTTSEIPAIVAIFIAIGVGLLCGLWNGILVAYFNIQPIIATLILMVSGRGIAQLITNGQIAVFNDENLAYMGVGVLYGLPFPIYLSIVAFIIVYLLVRRTAIGVLIESVGSNDRASFYAGINAAQVKLFAYAMSGVCAAIAGLIITGDIHGADANNAGLWLELDAILAVVIGGTALAGGRFYLGLSVIGALILQSLETGILQSGLPPTFNLVVKAIVILTVLLLQSAVFRQYFSRAFTMVRGTA
jgi:ribose/xylose/arabinose/galactoside ABC-type transport system permease subunit